MTTANEQPAAWRTALERYRATTGFDFVPDPVVAECFLILLEEAVREQVTDEVVDHFRTATAQVEARTAALTAEQKAKVALAINRASDRIEALGKPER
jgi:hypothetical protein